MTLPIRLRQQTAVLLGCLLAQTLSSSSARADEQNASFPSLPLSVAVAQVDGRPVTNSSWINRQIASANEVFAPARVSFGEANRRNLPARHARLETRRDRHALGNEVRDGVINVFVVASLRDVDDPSRYRKGVHWRPAGHPGKHFVIVTADAGDSVLAHELGHFFGNRQHSETPGNIMSYDRGDRPPFFDAPQIRRIRRFARRFLRTKEIVPASASRADAAAETDANARARPAGSRDRR